MFRSSVSRLTVACGISLAALSTSTYAYSRKKLHSASTKKLFTKEQVSKHKTREDRIWVTYQGGVYDITDFVESHPGGSDKIVLAAGGALEPFWALYQIHTNSTSGEPLKILESLKIGELDPADQAALVKDLKDPYAADPERHPALAKHGEKPFNAETPSSLIPGAFVTPNDLWYVRHHHPVPVVNPKEFRLHVSGPGTKPHSFSLDELKKLPKTEVTTTMQCAGNRRSELNENAKTSGLPWKIGAISTAKWGGVLLKDLLASVAFDDNSQEAKHVHFLPLDPPYNASIPVKRALDKNAEVLLAYEMNGSEIPPDHGYPIRGIVPGVVGARNVKWVSKVVTSPKEADSTWQVGVAYKGFSSSVKSFEGVDPTKVAAVHQLPVQSAICEPVPGAEFSRDEDTITCKGYAWSGGGNGIVRVEVSSDDGSTWTEAKLNQLPEQNNWRDDPGRAWAWSLWEADVPIPPVKKSVELRVRAVDTTYNSQPDRIEPLWNKRGILNNSQHRVPVRVLDDDDE